ncbi:MAG: DUF547 domain-containing protein [Bacteroidota bacterium]
MKIQTIFLLVFAGLLFVACKNQPDQATTINTNEPEKINIENVEPTVIANTIKEEEPTEPVTPESDERMEEEVENTNTEKLVNTSPVKEKPAAPAPLEEVVETPGPAPVEEIAEVEELEAPVTPEEPAEVKTPETKPEVVEEPIEEKSAPPPFSHDIWDNLTRKYVSSTGKVNYSGFKNDVAKLDEYLDLLKTNPPSGSRSAQLAYWINVYNAFTVKMIVDNYPVSSITKLHGGKPWNVRWIEVNGKSYTLDEVENAVIRPKFNDARIHFAVNCAAKSCPPLLNRAWTASNLESYLESQTKKFINNTAFNQIESNSVKLSKIFEWYAVDFGDLISYINKYSDVKVKPGTKVTYNEYDWGLNN